MNRDKIVKQILDEVPDNIRKESEDKYDKMVKARYLYLELCKRCHYNFEYNISSLEEQIKKFNENHNEEENDDIGMCNDFSIIGVEIFKKMGLKAVAIDVDGNEYREEDKINNPLHIYFMFSLDERDKNGNAIFYLADPAFDLKRVQIGCATKYFASNPKTINNPQGYNRNLAIFPQEKIKEIDQKIGYCKCGYTDEILNRVIVEISNLKLENKSEYESTVYKVEKILEELEEKVFSRYTNTIRTSDRQSAYKMIFYKAFPKEMNNHIIDFNTHKDNRGQLVSTLIIKQDGQVRRYVYKDGSYREDEEEER